MTSGRPVRIGLVGYGKGGRFFHAPLITAAPGCELAGVVARSASRRADADLLTVRAVIGSGELGRVIRFESRIEQYAPPGGIPSSGGGILFDLGAHVVDQALLLFGPVRSVYTELDDAGGVPGRFFIAARHTHGVVSHLTGDLLLHGTPGSRFRVFGTTATYDAGSFDGQADELMAGGSPAAAGEDWGVVPPEHWGRLHTGPATKPWPSERGDWRAFYTLFATAVRGLGPVPVDPWDAVAGLEVLEAAQRSAATGQVVEF